MRLSAPLLTAALSLSASNSFAHDSKLQYRPESHAPANVMAEHLHRQGEWMLGYRFMSRNYRGIYRGADKVSSADAAMEGYASVASTMTMEMHMLDIMYAVSDTVTLMLMPLYMTMDMEMEDTSMLMDMEEHGEHGGHAAHEHSTSGPGDTTLSALIRLYRSANHQLHATLGVSAPTGSVDEKMADGSYVHYGMQLGSGTWDLVPNLTYTGHVDAISWGAQLGGTLRMENENESGFAFGDKYFATGWTAYRFAEWGSVSLRLEYQQQEDIDGHYNGSHNHGSPPDFQTNYGGEFVDLGFGINLVPQYGPLAGVRLGLEWIIPLKESYNGFQIGRDNGVSTSLSYAF